MPVIPLAQGPLPTRLIDLRHTTVFRLIAGMGAVFMALLLALLWLTYVLTNAELNHRIDQFIVARAEVLARKTAHDRLDYARVVLHDEAGALEAVAVFDRGGALVLGDPALRPPFPLGRVFERMHGPRGAPVHALALSTRDGMTVVISRDVTLIIDLRARVMGVMVASGAIALIVVLVAGLALSRGPIRRIRAVQATATRIALGELALRVPIGRRGDEFDMIAAVINTMVADIERLLRQVKGATDAIAHDMRTPLSHVRTRLDRIALLPVMAGDPDGEAAQLLAGARGELDAALGRFRALLRISELEAADRRACIAPLDPFDLIEGVAELYEPLADERGLTLRIEGARGLTMAGDERLLFEAVSNLVENAIKFSPPDGAIVLSVGRRDDRVAIAVRDHGPGIAPAERDMVLDRFQRGSGSGAAPGHGLGLSLVAAIVALHGFALRLDHAQPGLLATIEAPAP